MSVEHVAQQVKELKTSLAEMSKNIKKAPADFRKQMENFLEVQYVYCSITCMLVYIITVYFYTGGKQ